MVHTSGPPPEHKYQLGHADIHLAYLGWELFIQLVPWDTLIQVLPSTGDTTQVVIGELSASESKTLDNIIHADLGVGIPCDSSTTLSVSARGPTKLPKLELELQNKPKTKLTLPNPWT